MACVPLKVNVLEEYFAACLRVEEQDMQDTSKKLSGVWK
jgi:hypothetical protein